MESRWFGVLMLYHTLNLQKFWHGASTRDETNVTAEAPAPQNMVLSTVPLLISTPGAG